MDPVLDHVQITVRDMEAAVAFYDRLMPLLGYDLAKRTRATIAAHEFEVVDYGHPTLSFTITSPRPAVAHEAVHRRRPGSVHHMAWRVVSRAEVDRLHEELVRIGARIVEPPREYPEFVPKGYYAVFFKDPDGMKYEIVHAPHDADAHVARAASDPAVGDADAT